MPFQYAHIDFKAGESADYILSGIQRLAEDITRDSGYYLTADENRALVGMRPLQERQSIKRRALITLKEEFEELAKLMEKVVVVELKTAAEKWWDWRESQKHLYTDEWVSKLPDDIIYHIAGYFDENELTTTSGFKRTGFRLRWWKAGEFGLFLVSIRKMENWSVDAIKMFWIKNIIPQISYWTERIWGLDETERETETYFREELLKSVLNWNKATLIKNLISFYEEYGNVNSFKFKYCEQNHNEYGDKRFCTINNFQWNCIKNKELLKIIQKIDYLDKTYDLKKWGTGNNKKKTYPVRRMIAKMKYDIMVQYLNCRCCDLTHEDGRTIVLYTEKDDELNNQRLTTNTLMDRKKNLNHEYFCTDCEENNRLALYTHLHPYQREKPRNPEKQTEDLALPEYSIAKIVQDMAPNPYFGIPNSSEFDKATLKVRKL